VLLLCAEGDPAKATLFLLLGSASHEVAKKFSLWMNVLSHTFPHSVMFCPSSRASVGSRGQWKQLCFFLPKVYYKTTWPLEYMYIYIYIYIYIFFFFSCHVAMQLVADWGCYKGHFLSKKPKRQGQETRTLSRKD
jgi:hypothetical protein